MPYTFKDVAPDPILTGFAVEFGHGGGFIADDVAPQVPVEGPTFKVPTYKNNRVDDDVLAAVGPNDSANEVVRYKPTFSAATALRYALRTRITREVRLAPGVNPLANAQNATLDLTAKLRLGVEKRVKTLLDNATGTATPTTKWDAASGMTIEKDVDVRREAFAKASGYEATHIVIPPDVAKVMKRDSTIRDLQKYTNPDLLIGGDLPPTLWGLRVIIPGAFVNSANPGLSQNIARVWSTDNVYLVYVDPSFSGTGLGMTALGQFRWMEWGTPFAAYTWPDPDKSVKADHVAVEVYQTEVKVCDAAIQRLTDVLT